MRALLPTTHVDDCSFSRRRSIKPSTKEEIEVWMMNTSDGMQSSSSFVFCFEFECIDILILSYLAARV